MKRSGRSAAPTFTSPAPWTSTDASSVWVEFANQALRSGHADFTRCGVQAGCRWRRRRRRRETCGAEKLVPSLIAYSSPACSGSVDDRICDPGAATSGLRAWPNGVRPPAEKLAGTPAQVVDLERVAVEADRDRTHRRRPSPRVAGCRPGRRSLLPVQAREHGEGGVTGTVLGDHDTDRARRRRSAHLRVVWTAASADEGDHAPEGTLPPARRCRAGGWRR